MEKRAGELRELNQVALRSLAEERRQLDEARTAFILEKAEAEEQQRLAAAGLAAREGELAQQRASLASHEEEVAAREQALGGALKEARDAAAAAETSKETPTSRRAARISPCSSRSARRVPTPLVSFRAALPRRSRSSTPPRTPTPT